MTAQNYKARCASLQSELDTSEAVQKDFVQLSQSLQIQLEKIRQSEQVRLRSGFFASCSRACAHRMATPRDAQQFAFHKFIFHRKCGGSGKKMLRTVPAAELQS